MKLKSILLGLVVILPAFLSTQAQDHVNIEISGDQYKQLEQHFNAKQNRDKRNRDWANFRRYEKDNAEIAGKKVKAVFMGNSITDNWAHMRPEFFSKNGYVGRGIGGQTSSEMLVRFRADVIDLHPKVVIILAGTNDVAGNNGFITMEHTMQNIQSMCELAKANKITPILCSVTPSRGFRWVPGFDPGENIAKLNGMIQEYAKKNGITYVDYFSALADENGSMAEGFSNDDCHPTDAGYEIMEPMAVKAIKKYVK